MELYLLRHAIAEEYRVGFPDSERALTAEGREKLADVMRVAAAAGLQPDVIVSSPYKRAMQTAEDAAKLLGYDEQILLSREITPAGIPENAWQEVRELSEADSVMLVSHEPFVSIMSSYLLGATSLVMSFKKSGLSCFLVEPTGSMPVAELKWLLTPALARGILLGSRKQP